MIRQRLFGDLPREVFIVTAAAFSVAVGFGVLLPAIPIFARTFGVNNAAIGLIVSMFAFTRFASGLISGKFVEKIGERFVFTAGVMMVAFFSVLVGLATSYHQLLFFRAAGGLGSSMFSVAASSVILRSVSDEQRARAQSLYNGSFLLGGIAGPAIGGLLSLISLRAPFFTYALSLFIAGVIASVYLKNSEVLNRAKNSHEKVETFTVKMAWRFPAYRMALAMAFIFAWVLFGLRASILPIFVVENLHSTTAMVGYGLTLSALVQGSILLRAGRLSDQRGRRYVSRIGSSIVLIGVLPLAMTNHPWIYLLAMAVLGLGGAFLSTVPASVVGDIMTGKGGQVIGLFQMASDAGMIVGPLVVGYISDIISIRAAFFATAIVFLIALVISFRLPETRNREEGPTQSADPSGVSS